MKIILDTEELKRHDVSRYQFKSINLRDGVPVNKGEKVLKSSVPQKPDERRTEAPEGAAPVAPAAIPMVEGFDTLLKQMQEKSNSFSESLLKKIDELSSSQVKMEMRLEKQQEEFEVRLKEERERAFEEGRQAGAEALRQELEGKVQAKQDQIAASIAKMQSTADAFQQVSTNLEKELVDAAIDIAKEVLQTELKEHSAQVAHNLATSLLQEVKGAMKITIRVHPSDSSYLKDKMGDNQTVSIVPDPAISQGGVVIESDAGNVDGTIMKRFQAIKRNILEH